MQGFQTQCYKLFLSCSLDGLPKYVHIWSSFDLAQPPHQSRRLLILATSSLRSILADLGLSETFDSEIYVPPITSITSLDRILREVELFPNESQRQDAIRMLTEAGFSTRGDGSSRLQIGIKKLLSIIEMARQEPDSVAERLLNGLTGLGM